MADFTFRVTPAVLEQKAEEFSTLVSEIEIHFNRLEETASRTRGYWQGEAGNQSREGYASYWDDIQHIVKRLSDHPVNLLKMAGIYKRVEHQAQERAARLETENIV